MIKKGLAVVIIVLFISMIVAPSSGLMINNSESLETNKGNDILGNRPPYVPSNPIPEDEEDDVPINEIFLSWTGGDPDEDDKVKYDVYFGKSSPPPSVVYNEVPTSYDPGIMDIQSITVNGHRERDGHILLEIDDRMLVAQGHAPGFTLNDLVGDREIFIYIALVIDSYQIIRCLAGITILDRNRCRNCDLVGWKHVNSYGCAACF